MSNEEVKNNIEPKWYVFRVQSGKEDYMVQTLKNSFKMLARDGIKGEDYFLDFNIPMRTVVEYKGNKKVEKQIRAYPGYMFLKVKMADEIVLFLKKFFRQNGYGAELPRTLTDKEYEAMLNGVSGMSEEAKNMVLHIGQKVKLKSGSFATMEGDIVSINEDEQKLVVNVKIFGVDTKIDATFAQIEVVEN